MDAVRPPPTTPATDAASIAARSAVPVLIVDDDPAKRLALKAVLAPLGYLIVEADSGENALRCLMVRDFAVILLDVRMPITDGFETAALIRQRRQSETTPIIFITGHASDELGARNGFIQGAVDFIFAPVQPDELRAKVSVFANLFIKAEARATEARAVQTSADQLRLLTEAAPIGIFQTDIQNRYVYTNPCWSEISGISPKEAFGKPWQILIGPEQHAELLAESADAEAQAELHHRFEIQTPGSAPRIVLVTSKSIPGTDGCNTGWVGTLADVTAEAGAEAAMAYARDKANGASRLKSDFLANMSHEIRTPMNGVIGMTDLLLETSLDARQRDYATTVRTSGEALLTIINDILDFSKIEAGQLEVEDIEFALRTVVDDVTDLLAGSAHSKGLELIAVIDSDIPPVVSGDPGRVRQVLTNLIGNAIKFTQAGEVVVRVSKVKVAGADTLLRFEVADTGDGIAPEKLDAIFQPFVQADSSTSRRYGGTGLGLAISAQLVALMGGERGVVSEVGRGSTFWFTIRVHADTEQANNSLLPPDAGLAGVSVLIVDDNSTQRTVLAGYLSDWGMTVSTAGSGDEALVMLQEAIARRESFGVALLDRSMPGMDGSELKSAIVDVDPTLAARLVLMTDSDRGQDQVDAGNAVVCATLSKPIHRESLHACLQVVLGLVVAYVAEPDAEPLSPPSAHSHWLGRLLLAEDNLINQKVALAMLDGSGYQVDTVLDGAAAVRAISSQHYDAVLMDCQMPELNGYEATKTIRAMAGPRARIPIIAMTAGARQEDKEHCLEVGMDSYLAKPVSKDTLLGMLARWVPDSAEVDSPAPDRPAARLDPPDPPDAISTSSVLDSEIVGRLERLGEAAGEDLIGQLAVLFLADADRHLLLLRQAVAASDATGVGLSAHSMKGASANLGATGLARMCGALEDRSLIGDLDGAGALIDAISAELERVHAALGALAPAP